MRNILLGNAIVEIIGGFILIFNPQFLLSNPNPELQGIVIAKLYGIMIFAVGVISYILYKNFDYTLMYKHILLLLIGLHFVIGLYMYGVFQQSLTPHLGATITHVSLAIIFVLIYLKNNHKFEDGEPVA
jgi:hypothetical protein